MKKEAINELSTADLMERIEATRTSYVKMKLQHAVSPLDNPNKLRETRKEIARMLTELTKRQKAENVK
ncbi:MAG: 50S ribosomal protein L29 [Candidatus Limimorpha sp.]|jgi:large subunit ribosomal protein L29|nr:50S ribosomal protein L29 [Bacteroidales bacterium]MCI7377524.1 50S ribosomal protein L29 [Bacteroidales bacterium]MDD5978461.1 50S ribosomal protein L29 [Bacteroidales bacterium]MDD7277481.1 50S ribosomal protein L29 [Bacteroidales bacterium]MDY6075755.1 50S ribosomal protein L29 [Bacteroidales bacterium]